MFPKTIKVKSIQIVIITLLIIQILGGCSVTNLQKRGYVAPKNFHTTIHFTISKTLIVLPVSMNGVNKNFLFDTGAQISLIQRDSVVGQTSKISGASKREMSVGEEIIESIKIGEVDFRETYAGNGDLVGLKEQIPSFGGLIGEPIINKANWLIDFPNNRLEVSDRDLSDKTLYPVAIDKIDGSPYTNITINGKKYKAIIDLGSSTALTVPSNTSLAKELLKGNKFKVNEREIFTIGGLQKTTEKLVALPVVKLGKFKIKEVEVSIRKSSQLRIGAALFKNNVVYIDNINGRYMIK